MAYHVSWRHQGSESVCAKEKIPQEKEETTGSSQKDADYNARMPQGSVIKSVGLQKIGIGMDPFNERLRLGQSRP